MIVSPKPKIKAREIVADIRSGIEEVQLQQKYGLSHESVDQVLSKLCGAGLLTETEIHEWRKSCKRIELPRHVGSDSGVWRCPSCNSPQPEEMDECPICGVVVRKVLSRRELNDYRPANVETKAQGLSWSALVMSIIVFVTAGTGLLWWAKHRSPHNSDIIAMGLNAGKSSGPDASGSSYEDVKEPSDGGDEMGDASSITNLSESASQLEQSPDIRIPQTKQSLPEKQIEPVSTKYRTGILRQFTSRDFQEEVVEASKTYPVLFQFYSNT
jgi:hypothetical protein